MQALDPAIPPPPFRNVTIAGWKNVQVTLAKGEDEGRLSSLVREVVKEEGTLMVPFP